MFSTNPTCLRFLPADERMRITTTLKIGIRNVTNARRISAPCGIPSVPITTHKNAQRMTLHRTARVFTNASYTDELSAG
jgi:hypothetical protein